MTFASDVFATAQLDGLGDKARRSGQQEKRAAPHESIEDWLDINDGDSRTDDKRVRMLISIYPYSSNDPFVQVRWADVEERREQAKMRQVGFVVGQVSKAHCQGQ